MNYYSFAVVKGALRWPPDLQIIGKDILIPAHGVYWPIMLLALGLELPKHLLVHGFWTNSGAKISKSNAKSLVDPVPYIEKFGPDALRYFVLREMVLGQDADFSDERFETRYTGDLGKKLGNLVQRTLSMINSYRAGVIPNYDGFHLTEADAALRSDAVVEEYKRAVDQFAPHLALQAVWEFVAQANEYIEKTAPFKLAKDPGAGQAARRRSWACWRRRCGGCRCWCRPRCPSRRKKSARRCSSRPGRFGWKRRSSAIRSAAIPSASPR